MASEFPSPESDAAAPGPGLSLRRAQILATVLLVYLAVWDVVAITRDNRLLLTDSLVEEMVWLDDQPFEAGLYGQWFDEWVQFKKGPLLPLVAIGLCRMFGTTVLTVRLMTLLAHWATLLVLFVAGRRLTGRAAAGLWAVVIYGTFPGAYGWGRSGGFDPLVAPFVVGCLLIMMRRPLTARAMVLLGALAGLATLFRSSFPLFAGAPALLFAVDQLRRPGRRLLPLWAAVTAVAVVAWWVVPAFDTLTRYAGDSSYMSEETTLTETLTTYLFDVRGTWLLYLGAVIGGVALWVARSSARLGVLMIGAAVVVPLAFLVGWFDPVARYALPTYSVAALLCAAGLSELWTRVRRPAALPWVAAAALLALHAWHNSGGYPTHPWGREMGAGMVAADTRPYDAWPRVVRFCRQKGVTLYPLFDPMLYAPCPSHTRPVWSARKVEPPVAHEAQAAEAFLAGEAPIHLVVCHRDNGAVEAMNQQLVAVMNRDTTKLVSRVMAGRKTVLLTAADPYANEVQGDIKMSVVRVDAN